ncbi:MAG: methyltransferase domain-containing protein [Anaerolineae bacterium]|nr:methyltransferase domain-containing protein [Anaerolineae bacterium]
MKLWFRLVGFGFRLLYYEFAWTYDVVSWMVSLGDWRRWQLAALPFVSGRDVLEIGHGPGHMLLALQNARFDVVGLDLSPYMGRQALKRTQRTVPLLRGDVQNLPFETAVFDTVLSTFPTDYIVAPETLAEVARVLRQNGRFVIVPEGHLTNGGVVNRFIEWLFTITGQRLPIDKGQPVPLFEMVWQPYLQRFEEAGFTLRFEQIQLERSALTVMIAEKIPSP